MALNLVKRKNNGKNIVYAITTFILLCALFFTLIAYLYNNAEANAYENLHMQTKQIKDDIHLQILSDRENLATMANFAAKLYSDGDGYDLLFNSFKPIGLIENIGILYPDNVFVTRTGSMDLDTRISFEEEAARGAYISGRVDDLTIEDNELIRSAVPVTVGGETVGILYGVIKLDKIEARYHSIAEELDAQLFVYDDETGNLIIDTVHDELGNISFLKDRKYNKNYSYEQMETTENGFLSFASVYKDENVHMHYSAIDDINWSIALVRYDSQVFAAMNTLVKVLSFVFLGMAMIMGAFLLMLMKNERRRSAVTDCASEVRKTLLETSGNRDHIAEALEQVCTFTGSRSAVFFDTEGDDYDYIASDNQKSVLLNARRELLSELVRYISESGNQPTSAIQVVHIKVNDHFLKTNPSFYKLLSDHNITDVVFSATVDNANHVTVLCVINPKRIKSAQMLAEKISACFSMALNNRNQLSRTRLAAMTDSLTGALNRVAYTSDLALYNEGKPLCFSCIYVDVNELHIRNNKYGHSAGDEMLLYISNTLKKVFFGSKVYRMGGDEFLVFCQNIEQEDIKKNIEIFLEELKPKNYQVAIGMSYRSQNTNTEEMVREAEIRMYEAKAKYYQDKEQQSMAGATEKEYVQVKTGILEIDTMLSVLKENYNGIYRVSLDTDMARRVLMPAYLKYNETEEHFSRLFSKYVSESVVSDYHRALLNFRNYDALKQQLALGKTPKITYKKLDGETVTLSVYKLCDLDDANADTLWIFAKK